MKILITGSDGFSGSNYCKQAHEAGHEVLGVDLTGWFVPGGCRIERLDIRDREACMTMCRTFQPDAVIHTARAPGHMWALEKDRIATYAVNALGTMNLARGAAEVGATFVFLSTDWVFDGTKPIGEKYAEEDGAYPLNYYGVSKWIAECEIRQMKTKWLIIRPAHIYGVHAAMFDPVYAENMGLLEKTTWANLWQSIQKGDDIRVPDDMYQSPVWVNHLVETTLRLLEKGMAGSFHLTDRDCVSRYRIARSVLGALGMDCESVRRGRSEDFARSQHLPHELLGIFPLNTCLDVGKIENALGTKMMTFEDGVSHMKSHLAGLGLIAHEGSRQKR